MCKVFGKHQSCEVVPIKKAYDDQKTELREHISRCKKHHFLFFENFLQKNQFWPKIVVNPFYAHRFELLLLRAT